jgi:hypothetical protein
MRLLSKDVLLVPTDALEGRRAAGTNPLIVENFTPASRAGGEVAGSQSGGVTFDWQ